MNPITLSDIEAARRRIAGKIERTATVPSAALAEIAGVPVFLKLEHRQTTGSFKLRGASNAIASLADAEKRRGVVAASTGNHGRALAYAAKLEGDARGDLHVEAGAGQQGRRNPSPRRGDPHRRQQPGRRAAGGRPAGRGRRVGHAAALRSSRHHRRARDARAGDRRAGAGRRDGAGAAFRRRAGGRRRRCRERRSSRRSKSSASRWSAGRR